MDDSRETLENFLEVARAKKASQHELDSGIDQERRASVERNIQQQTASLLILQIQLLQYPDITVKSVDEVQLLDQFFPTLNRPVMVDHTILGPSKRSILASLLDAGFHYQDRRPSPGPASSNSLEDSTASESGSTRRGRGRVVLSDTDSDHSTERTTTEPAAEPTTTETESSPSSP